MMRACANHRQSLALLAIGALEAPEAEALRAHGVECEGCRDYLVELEEVARKVRGAEAAQVDDAPFLHRRVRHRLLETRPRPAFSWRMMVPALGVVAFVVVVLPWLHKSPPTKASPIAALKSDAPTVLNYQAAANHSFEQLDAVLDQQGARALPPAPVVRAGSLGASAD